MASESEEVSQELESENYESQEDDLEKTLMLAAANADRRISTSLSVTSEEEVDYPQAKKLKTETPKTPPIQQVQKAEISQKPG